MMQHIHLVDRHKWLHYGRCGILHCGNNGVVRFLVGSISPVVTLIMPESMCLTTVGQHV